MKIPRILFQTSKQPPLRYVVEQLKAQSVGWTYIHFCDADIIKFFRNNPHPEFPEMVEKFLSIPNGAHKADLFRYYFLYLYGGVFLDQDAMLRSNLDRICDNYSFFSVNSSYVQKSIFQGLIGAVPKNPIIYFALKDMYDISIDELQKNYHCVCEKLYDIIYSQQYSFPWHLYQESFYDNDTAKVTDGENTTICLHYFNLKIIPTTSDLTKKTWRLEIPQPKKNLKMPIAIKQIGLPVNKKNWMFKF